MTNLVLLCAFCLGASLGTVFKVLVLVPFLVALCLLMVVALLVHSNVFFFQVIGTMIFLELGYAVGLLLPWLSASLRR